MPAASSPYSGNDYSAIKYRGYRLPGNEIFRSISAQDEFWKIGASRVKQVYDNALDLKLSLEPNKQLRNQFMEDADKEMTKLSSMNVADPSVQRQGFDIFKPLFKDEGIVSDDQATRHIDSIQSDIQQFREKENGKYYNNTNAMYALDGVHEFKNSKDRMAGKTYLQNAKEYEPYYDASPELNTILKNCKPEEYSRDVESGMNIVTYSSKALSSVRLSGCISAGLSDKAKRQLSIDGYVTYKNNPQALRDAYLPVMDATRAQLQEENAAYSGVLANKDKLSSLSEQQLQKIGLTKDTIKQVTPQLLKSFEDRVKGNQLRIDNFNKTISQLGAGDFTSIMGDNLEPIASMVYSKGYADNYAAAYSYNTPPSTKIKSNPGQMLIYRENREDLRQDDQQDFLLKMEGAKAEDARQLQLLKNQAIKGKGKNGNPTAMDLINAASPNPAFEKDVAVTGDYDKLTEERNNIEGQQKTLDDYFLPQLRGMRDSNGNSLMPDTIVTDKDFYGKSHVFQNWYNNFRKTLPEEDPNWPTLKDYEDQMGRHKVMYQMIKNNQEEIDKLADQQVEIPKGVGNEYAAKLDMGDGVVLNKSPLDVIKDIRSGIAKGTSGDILDDAGLSDYIPGSHGQSIIYRINGKDYELSTDNLRKSSPNAKKLIDAIHSYGKDLVAKKNELAKTKTIVQKEGYTFPELDDKENPIKQRILQDSGIGVDNNTAITLGQTDLRGNVEVFIHPDASSNPKFDAGDVIDNLKKRYDTNFIPFPGSSDKNHFILGGFPELNKFTSSEMNTSELMLPYVRSIESHVDNKNSGSTGLLPSHNPSKSFGMEITTSSRPGQFKYKVHDESNNILGVYDDRVRALQALNGALENFKGAKVR